jgi:hypothetical protein
VFGAELLPVAEGKKILKKKTSLKEWGYLYITAEPDYAAIEIEGEKTGKGEAFYNNIGPRLKYIKVSAENHETVEGYVELVEREVIKIFVKLKSLGGNLTVITIPCGAEVYLDNELTGITPVTIKGIISGEHNIFLKKEKWSYEASVHITKDQTSLVSIPISEPSSHLRGSAPKEKTQTAPQPEKTMHGPAFTPAPKPEPATEPKQPQPAPAPSPQPVPPPAEDTSKGKIPDGYKPNCDKICEHFVAIVSGSPTIKSAVESQCMKNCEEKPAFGVCAWRAKTMDDVIACMKVE